MRPLSKCLPMGYAEYKQLLLISASFTRIQEITLDGWKIITIDFRMGLTGQMIYCIESDLGAQYWWLDKKIFRDNVKQLYSHIKEPFGFIAMTAGVQTRTDIINELCKVMFKEYREWRKRREKETTST